MMPVTNSVKGTPTASVRAHETNTCFAPTESKFVRLSTASASEVTHIAKCGSQMGHRFTVSPFIVNNDAHCRSHEGTKHLGSIG